MGAQKAVHVAAFLGRKLCRIDPVERLSDARFEPHEDGRVLELANVIGTGEEIANWIPDAKGSMMDTSISPMIPMWASLVGFDRVTVKVEPTSS